MFSMNIKLLFSVVVPIRFFYVIKKKTWSDQEDQILVSGHVKSHYK